MRGWRLQGAGLLEQAWAVLRGGAAVLVGWYERARQRRQLARLDDRLLRDIGLNRIDAAREADKPFWRE